MTSCGQGPIRHSMAKSHALMRPTPLKHYHSAIPPRAEAFGAYATIRRTTHNYSRMADGWLVVPFAEVLRFDVREQDWKRQVCRAFQGLAAY